LDSKGITIPSKLASKFKNFANRQLELAGRADCNQLVYALALDSIREVQVPQQPSNNYTDCGCYLIAFARVIMDTVRKTIETTGDNVKFEFYDIEADRSNTEIVEQWIANYGRINPDAIREDIRREVERKVDT